MAAPERCLDFSASTTINREDFDVSFGAVMEAGGLVVATGSIYLVADLLRPVGAGRASML